MRGVNALAPTLPRRTALRRSLGEAAADHLNAVHRYVLVLTADPSLAEDLTAETFEKALRSWRRFDPRRGSERTWLCRIGRRVALDHFRAESRRRRREERYSLVAGGQVAVPVELGFSPELVIVSAGFDAHARGGRRSFVVGGRVALRVDLGFSPEF